MFTPLLRRLQGGNLEVFKFGLYIIFPIGWMYYFGTNLEERFSVPDFWPKPEQSHKIPLDREEIDAELQRMGRQKKLRLQMRQAQEQAQEQTQLQASSASAEESS